MKKQRKQTQKHIKNKEKHRKASDTIKKQRKTQKNKTKRQKLQSRTKRPQTDRFQCCLVVAKKRPKITENRKHEKTFFRNFCETRFSFFRVEN